MERDPVERVLDLALGELAPSATDKARHRLLLGLGPGAGAGSAAVSAGVVAPRWPLRSWQALRASGGAGWTAGALLLGAGLGIGFWLRGAVEERAPAAAVMAAPAVAGATPPAASALRSVPPPRLEPAHEVSSPSGTGAVLRERASSRPERRASSHSTSTGGAGGAERSAPQQFDAELALLQRVERALRANNPSLAAVLLDELDQSFPETRLGEERQAARRIAECRLQLPGWRQRAERFLLDSPGSMYSQRVRAACSLE